MNKHFFTKSNNSGFSLTESLIILFLIAIIAAFFLARFFHINEHDRIIKAKNDIEKIQSALNLYKLDNGMYPTNQQGLLALVRPPRIPPLPQNYKDEGYLIRLPVDPWGRQYQYANPGVRNPNSVDVFTYGASNLPPELGNKEVVGNWQSPIQN